MGLQHETGGYDKEQKAAIAYDLAALKYWGPTATTNFPVIFSTAKSLMLRGIYVHHSIYSLMGKGRKTASSSSFLRGTDKKQK